MALRQTLGHDSKDGVVAADAGTVFLVVLLGVTDLKELRLQEEQVGRGSHLAKGRDYPYPEIPLSTTVLNLTWVKFISLFKIHSVIPNTGKQQQIYSVSTCWDQNCVNLS